MNNNDRSSVALGLRRDGAEERWNETNFWIGVRDLLGGAVFS